MPLPLKSGTRARAKKYPLALPKKPVSAFGSLALGTLVLTATAAYTSTASAQQVASLTKEAVCDPYQDYACLDRYLGTGFWERFANYYRLEWNQSGPPSDPKAPPARREDYPPAAQSIPPMPFTEWPYGGTSAFGATRPNSVDSPLMAALGNTEFGQWMNDRHLQVYGWINGGANLSTNSTKPGGNWPAAYSYTPNRAQLDQAVVYLERLPDTVQKDHVDWGMRLSAIYGMNYRYTTSYGLASDQLLKHNKTSGYDFPMMYGEIFFPQVANGMMVRFGRYISLPDIEAQLAPNNYMYTHSMTYTFDNYTNTGVLASFAVGKNLILQGGVTVGTEATIGHLHKKLDNPYPDNPALGQVNPIYPNATFKADPGAQPSLTFCGRYNSDDSKDSFNVCANGINNGRYGYNNLQWYGATIYHQIDSHWHIAAEAYTEHQNQVPNALNSVVQNVYANNGSPFSSAFMPFNAPNLAQCANASALTCKATAIGMVAYLNYSPDAFNNFSIRPEYFSDPQGQRTGTAAHFTNIAFGWQHWFSPQLQIRPEIALYHANVPAFNGNYNAGIPTSKRNAAILSADLTYHF